MEHTVTREQIAHYVGHAFDVTWATRSQLLRTAFNHNAPHEVINELVLLPERYYRNLDQLCEHLPHVPASA